MPRSSRAKQNLAWEKVNNASEGMLKRRAHQIRQEFPAVTCMESRITALKEAGWTNSEIALLFVRSPGTIDNESYRARRKMGVAKKLSPPPEATQIELSK